MREIQNAKCVLDFGGGGGFKPIQMRSRPSTSRHGADKGKCKNHHHNDDDDDDDDDDNDDVSVGGEQGGGRSRVVD